MQHERGFAVGRSETTREELAGHCGVLGLSGGEDKKAVQKAFRQKARDTHPDITRDDGQDFKAAHEAYEALTADAEKAVGAVVPEAVMAPGVSVAIVSNRVAPIFAI